MRTASYARFSSDLQRDTSIDDQLRNCQDYAERHDWTWQPDQVYTDAAVSGASLDGRPRLQALLTAAASSPRPFDVLLVDDSSRVSRDLSDALRIVQRLTFAGVRVVYISQGIDSESEQHETLIAVHGLVDGLYLREMAAKIKRGLKGQVSRGFSAGSRTFGYQSIAVHDPQRPGTIIGHRLEVDPLEANVVRQIFEWYASGHTIPSILSRVATEYPRGPRGHGWRVGAVKRVLRNPKYTGQLVWGRTQRTRRPGARFKASRLVAQDQWHTLPAPALRIITDDLWTRAEARRIETDARLDAHRQPGSNLLRGRHSGVHSKTLFGGFLSCGECGSTIGIVTNRAYRGRRYRYYGCQRAHRGENSCTNTRNVRVEPAERALLAGLQAELLKPETLDYLTTQLAAALNALHDQRPAQREALDQAHQTTVEKLRHLVAAVENGAGSTTIFQAIETREAEIRALATQRAALTEPVHQRLAVMPAWVRQQLSDAAGLVASTPERARLEFHRLGIRFALHQTRGDDGTMYLRAVGSGAFEDLAFAKDSPFPRTDRSLHQPAGSRTFVVDLPAGQKRQARSA